jgi:hypothetical protein
VAIHKYVLVCEIVVAIAIVINIIIIIAVAVIIETYLNIIVEI